MDAGAPAASARAVRASALCWNCNATRSRRWRLPQEPTRRVDIHEPHRPPYGEIFAAMMLCCAAGTRLFGFLAESRGGGAARRCLSWRPFLWRPSWPPRTSCWPWWPSCSSRASWAATSRRWARSVQIVPDAQPSTIYNIFRVQLASSCCSCYCQTSAQTVRRVGVTTTVGGHIATHALRGDARPRGASARTASTPRTVVSV